MGLDTSHEAFHGPYTKFNAMRYWLAAQVGINLNEYIGYMDPGATKSLEELDHDLQPLLNHSDCDGKLTPAESRRIVKGIKQALSAAKDKKCWEFNAAYVFMTGCIRAANAGEDIDFH